MSDPQDRNQRRSERHPALRLALRLARRLARRPVRRGERAAAREQFLERWRAASAAEVADLDGHWQVIRLSGPVPMDGIYKVVRAGSGRTGAWWSPLPDLRFTLSRLQGSVLLRYQWPLSFLADEFRRESDGCWLGRARAFGRQYAWFRMVPMQVPMRAPAAERHTERHTAAPAPVGSPAGTVPPADTVPHAAQVPPRD